MSIGTDCCGNFIRFFLFLINGIFLILGLVLFILTAVLKWTDWIKGFEIKELNDINQLGSINSVTIVLLVIGGFMVVISAIGIIGALRISKFFLIIYEILIVLLFLTHGITLLVVVFSRDSIETKYIKLLNETAKDINDPSKDGAKCDLFKVLSKTFDCCGAATGPGDFNSLEIAESCCSSESNSTISKNGCGPASIDYFEKHATNLLIIPSGTILTIELFVIIMIPILIGKRKSYDY